MPTGYTADVGDGTITEFSQFALRCARAFGALVTMRDDPMDTPIPTRMEPAPYYAQAVQEAEARLRELEAMTPDAAEAAAERAYQVAVQTREERRQRSEDTRARYTAMLAKVEAWEPPTPEHVEMKKFMRQQLQESIKFDCLDDGDLDRFYAVERKTGPEWLAEARKSAREAVAYRRDELEKEVARTSGRTKWIEDLIASLHGNGVAVEN